MAKLCTATSGRYSLLAGVYPEIYAEESTDLVIKKYVKSIVLCPAAVL
jgi:hypothetical protein